MRVLSILSKAEKLVADNSPSILTALAVTGTVTTAYLTGKASFKAAELIDIEESRAGTADSWKQMYKERVRLCWKLYIPAAGTGVLTVGCIIGANRISSRRTAALASAFSISEKAWAEYKEKVVERIGPQKEQHIRDAMAQDQIDRNPVSTREVIITNGEVLCYDGFSGRYFTSSVESLRKAMNDINYEINNNMYASLYDFYMLIGLPPTDYSQEVGWNADNLLDLTFSTTMSDDSRPCVAMYYATNPIRDYHRLV